MKFFPFLGFLAVAEVFHLVSQSSLDSSHFVRDPVVYAQKYFSYIQPLGMVSELDINLEIRK